MSLQALIEAVQTVAKDEDVFHIASAFKLQKVDRSGTLDQILGVYTGTVDGHAVSVEHSWHDRCRVMQIQPDGNRVKLEVDGQQVASGSYLDER